MNKTTILPILLGLLLLAGGSSESFAWSKTFNGTRDQVRAACQGPGMVLTENPQSHSTGCGNDNNGTAVACNDAGHCQGVGPGPMPRLVDTSFRGVVVGMLMAKLKGQTLDPWVVFGDPHSGQSGSDAGGGAAGWDTGDFGQWHANPGGGVVLGGGIFATH